MDPLLLSLHGSLVALSLRVTRIERALQLHEPIAQLQTPPLPAAASPCSCDEALELRERLRTVLAAIEGGPIDG